MKKSVCLKLNRNCKIHVRTIPPSAVEESFIREAKIVNGESVMVTMCPPAHDKWLEFDASTSKRSGGYRSNYNGWARDDKPWCPTIGTYKALSKSVGGSGCYILLDKNPDADGLSTGLAIARALISSVMKYMKTSRALPEYWQDLLGCDLDTFRQHIESLFTPGMHWGNWGEWHLDHIKPLSSFSLDFQPELLDACHYKNMQPLWAFDNLSKSFSY